VAAQEYLKKKIKSGQTKSETVVSATVGGASSTRFTSEEQLQLEQLQFAIGSSNKALNTIKTLQPEISKVQREIGSAMGAYNKLFDLTPKLGPKKKNKKNSGDDVEGENGEGTGTSNSGGGAGSAGGADDYFTAGKAKKISQGGQRNITINIGKQIEHMELHVMSNQDAGREMESIIRESLVRVLHSINGDTNGGI
jgi:hypothetical protein